MFLLLDLSEKDKIHLALFDKKSVRQAQDKIEHKYYSGRNREILTCIDKIVHSSKFSIQRLMGIMVVVGAGSFTSTRMACVVANSFAYVLQIPLLAIKLSEVENIQKLIPKLLKQKPGHYISATYSGEPNLGK